MNILQAAILGLVQGLGEWSSAAQPHPDGLHD